VPVQDAADYLRVSESTILRLIKAKKLKARRVGRQWRVVETDLHRNSSK
jgi:excisionase family DNA binding protein